jgi:putative nucleotidyltransferase with HDIG domain
MSTTYRRVPIRSVIPELSLPVDVYVHLSEKYLKYLNKGDVLTADKYNKFMTMKVKHFHVVEEDIDTFISWVEREKEKVLEKDAQKVAGKMLPIVEANQEIREMIFDTFTSEDLTEDNVLNIQHQADKLIEKLQEDQRVAHAMVKLARYSGSLADHSVNVANMAVFLGLTFGHSHPLVLQNLYLGGLYHDYGKTKMDAKFWEQKNPNHHYSHAEQSHPDQGALLVKKSKKFPDQVVTIIAQHHELYSGAGYPRGLKGKEIYELSRIVSLANAYDNSCQEKRDLPERERLEKTLKILEYDRGKSFDPELANKAHLALSAMFAEIK